MRVTNGIDTIDVSKGAYSTVFKSLGFFPVEEEKKVIVKEQKKEPKEDDDEIFVEGLLEKPISSWNKAEIKRFAAIKDIDISETKNADEARALVKKYLEENE